MIGCTKCVALAYEALMLNLGIEVLDTILHIVVYFVLFF